MRGFSTLSLLAAVSGGFFASASPLSGSRYPRGGDVVDIDSVKAAGNVVTGVASNVGANNILNHNVEQSTRSRRGGDVVDIDEVKAIVDVITGVSSNVGVNNVLNHEVHQSTRDVVDIDEVKAIVDVITGVSSNVGVNNVLNHEVHQSARDVVDIDTITGVASVITGVASGVGLNNIGNSGVHQSTRRDEGRSLPVILLDVCARILPISNQLNSLIAVGVEVKVDIVVGLLNQIKVILAGAVAEIAVIVHNPTAVVFALEGRVLTIVEIGHIVASVIVIVTSTVNLAVFVVGVAQVSIIAAVVAEIGGLLARVIVSITAIAGAEGLVGVVVPLIGGIIPTIVSLNFAEVCAALNLTH